MAIRVLLVDDHALVRTGIRHILDEAAGIEVLAEASSGEEAVELARKEQPDVILMDVNMPGIGGMEATRKIATAAPDVKVIVVSVHATDPYPSRLLEAGAQGYLTKDCSGDEIITAVKRVHAGERYLSAEVARKLADSLLSGGKGTPLDQLSQRELQVMLMIIQGHSVQAISDKLFLSPKTVSTYRHRLFQKLEVENDVGLARFAIRHGLLDDSPLSANDNG
ncbi:UvrY/SirA/GacA family response regulator transcription factor [Natronospira bacteriovora]|uniref:UvrY/SirA/GacA family response regulator transcription factor n=1 Tax=Natronospira bacteriovora TaxID=3069753 RepID=A0ABU0WCU8_9GAMM|nr:UvrY/SirA/GacA family response regulator transcription factor [Natronospira sp. AB-CW4]MDQ2070755.1 UvrY/SirA/GacA family response regulator transcription factor [Natronospira sp. AB-CW4]